MRTERSGSTCPSSPQPRHPSLVIPASEPTTTAPVGFPPRYPTVPFISPSLVGEHQASSFWQRTLLSRLSAHAVPCGASSMPREGKVKRDARQPTPVDDILLRRGVSGSPYPGQPDEQKPLTLKSYPSQNRTLARARSVSGSPKSTRQSKTA